MRTSTGDVYLRASGSYSIVANLVGPTGATGAAGSNGTNGTNGTNGNSVLNGSGAPSGGTGNNGDFYVNTAANTIYGPKTAGAWGSPTSLVGPTGSTGATGPTGPAGPALGGALTAAHVVLGNASNVATDTAVTGDVTITNAGVTAIGSGKVTNAQLAGAIDLTSKVTGTLPVGNLPTGTGSSNVPTGGVITGAGPIGDASHHPVITYNAAGQLTTVTNTAIAIPESAVTNLTSDLAAKQTTTLTSGNILVGNGSNVAASVAVSGDATLANTGAVTIPALQKADKIGAMTIIGHSYTAGTTQSDSGTSNVYQESIVAKLQGLLGIHEQNVLHLGQAGSLITGGANVLGSAFAGWRGAAQFCLPNNSTTINAASDVVVTDPIVAVNGAGVIVHGHNDFLVNMAGVSADDTQRRTNNNAAGANAYRGILSRMRSGAVFGSSMTLGVIGWDSSIAFSAGTTTASVTRNSGPAYRRLTTNGQTFTVTLPSNFTGGTVAVNLIGQFNGVTHLNGAINNAVTTITVASGAEFVSGTAVIKIDSEEMVVTAGITGTSWTVTRAANGTSAASHSNNAVVTLATDAHKVNWSGTVAAASGSTSVSGQGTNANGVWVTKRFACTSADAGKTIIGTVANVVTGDTSAFVDFDSWQIEAALAPPIVLTNIQHWNLGETIYNTSANVAAWNTAVSNVVAEFDSWVQIADLYTAFFNRNGTIGVSMNATDVTTSGVTWTCNSSSFTPTVGMNVSFGPAFGEHCTITAVSGAAPNWTLTLTRGAGGTTKVTHSSGDFLGPLQWMHTDDLHLNGAGYGFAAELIYEAFGAMPTPAQSQIAQNQSVWSQYSQSAFQGVIDNNWYGPLVTAPWVSGGSITQNHQSAFPVFISKTSVLVGMAVVPNASSTGTIRFGIYLPDATHARPGRLLIDFGQTTFTSTGTWAATGLYQVLRPGWYWMSAALQSSTVAMKVLDNSSLASPDLSTTTAPTSASTNMTLNGYRLAGISGAFTDWGISFTEQASNGVTGILVISYQLRTGQFA